ncbi:MAG: AAA family ATPase [Clostridia bacterium]|nr:AAA family ATPase [Clostridia bacterium]
MKPLKTGSVPQLTIEKMIDQLSATYSKVINCGLSPKIVPSVMLWGPPGVGKSQAVRQIAKELERSTGKRCFVTDVRLLLFNPIDLRGIPTANEDKTLAVWLKPQIFNMNEDSSVINILFLDEISAAPMSVQAAAYQITLDRVVGEHKLPDNCIVIAAGNRVTDKSVAYKMPKALANRLCHIEVEGSSQSWMNWAVKSGINQRVIGFLNFRADYLMGFDATNDDLAFPTPRSWEMVSNVLNIAGGDCESVYPIIAGCIGTGVAIEFRSFCKLYNHLPKISDIFDGKSVPMPKDVDIMYALISSMAVYAREHKTDLYRIGNSIRFAMGMPADFSTVLLKSYMAIEKGYRDTLMKVPEFYNFISKKGALLNGNV